MKLEDKSALQKRILEIQTQVSDAAGFETGIYRVLDTLLREQGYGINCYRSMDNGSSNFASPERIKGGVYHVDFSDNIGIECKLRNSVAPAHDEVRTILQSALEKGFNRVMVVCNQPFSATTKEYVARECPDKAELIDFQTLVDWVDRIFVDSADAAETYNLLVKGISKEFARMIAADANFLDTIEWRELEKIIAEVFGGLGFPVELTRPGKDGGRDVILECVVNGIRKSFVVEVKHWRSGKQVGGRVVGEFLKVVVKESRDGGLMLSTSGNTTTAFESLTEIERRTLRFGNDIKICALCKTFLKVECGLYMPDDQIVDVFYTNTL